MRIDSASIGMDSARSYHASKTSVRRFEITDYQAGLTDVSTKGQKTPNGEDTTQNTEEQENTAENTTMTAKDWQSRLLVSSARWDMRSSASEQTLSTIREYTVRYIFDLLFPSRNSTLRDWMQENGWSSGNQTGNSWNTGNSVNNTQTNSGSTQGTATPASDVFNLVTSRVKILNYVSETWNIEQEDTSFSTALRYGCTQQFQELCVNRADQYTVILFPCCSRKYRPLSCSCVLSHNAPASEGPC